MSNKKRIALRPGERIFINGAVLKSEGRASFEILNDVPYLVEHEILQGQQTTTPLRQLYYILQTMILEPHGVEMTSGIFEETMEMLTQAFSNNMVRAGLEVIRAQVEEGSPFAALKTVRSLIPMEDAILGGHRVAELKLVGASA